MAKVAKSEINLRYKITEESLMVFNVDLDLHQNIKT